MKTSWDDYLFFLNVAESKSLYGAAKRLNVNHTTVFRRINALEEKLKTKLFERRQNGYKLTASGEQFYQEIKGFDEKINEATLKIIGGEVALQGNIRLAASDTIGFLLLPNLLKKFKELYPEITVELIVSPQIQDLSKREADIALRVSKNPSPYLFGKVVSKIEIGVLSSKNYKAQKSLAGNLEKDDWIVTTGQLENHPNNQWLLQKSTKTKIAAAGGSMITIAKLLESGFGLGVVPTYLAKFLSNLKVLHKIPALESKLWVLTHQDLKNNARIRLLMDFLSNELKELIK